MNYKPALLALSAMALAACGEQASDNENAVANQLEAADNVMWNDLANTSLDADLSTNATAPAAEAEVEAEIEAETPSPPARSTSREPTKAAASKAKAPEPAADPTPEPSAPPAETCAPEHRAAGHC